MTGRLRPQPTPASVSVGRAVAEAERRLRPAARRRKDQAKRGPKHARGQLDRGFGESVSQRMASRFRNTQPDIADNGLGKGRRGQGQGAGERADRDQRHRSRQRDAVMRYASLPQFPPEANIALRR